MLYCPLTPALSFQGGRGGNKDLAFLERGDVTIGKRHVD